MTSFLRSIRTPARDIALAIAVAASFCIALHSQTLSGEARTAQYFESIRQNPNELMAFLREMPKGGDLHNHLLGSVYA